MNLSFMENLEEKLRKYPKINKTRDRVKSKT